MDWMNSAKLELQHVQYMRYVQYMQYVYTVLPRCYALLAVTPPPYFWAKLL